MLSEGKIRQDERMPINGFKEGARTIFRFFVKDHLRLSDLKQTNESNENSGGQRRAATDWGGVRFGLGDRDGGAGEQVLFMEGGASELNGEFDEAFREDLRATGHISLRVIPRSAALKQMSS